MIVFFFLSKFYKAILFVKVNSGKIRIHSNEPENRVITVGIEDIFNEIYQLCTYMQSSMF